MVDGEYPYFPPSQNVIQMTTIEICEEDLKGITKFITLKSLPITKREFIHQLLEKDKEYQEFMQQIKQMRFK